jgi:hypothetical protein
MSRQVFIGWILYPTNAGFSAKIADSSGLSQNGDNNCPILIKKCIIGRWTVQAAPLQETA